MIVRQIEIRTALGSDQLEAVLVETGTGWTANLLPRPGYSMSGSAAGATQEEALEKLAELAQAQYEEQVALETRLYGPPQQQPS